MAIDYISLYPHVFYFISRYFDLWTMCHHFCLVKSSRLMAKPLFFTMFVLNTKRVAHHMTSLKLFMFCRSPEQRGPFGVIGERGDVRKIWTWRHGGNRRDGEDEESGSVNSNKTHRTTGCGPQSIAFSYLICSGWILWFMVDNWGAPSSISIYIYIYIYL